MNKTILTIVMATLCLNFSTKAQDNKAVDVTKKGIQIGQKVPDITLTNLHNYKDINGKPVDAIKLSDINTKLIILDFWATWCSPCVAMIPKMEALQTQFKGEVQILPVTYQTKDEALPFLKKLKKGAPLLLPQITDDKELNRLFPHVYLPHYVWIDYTGTVRAITGHEEITAENIDKILDNSIAKTGLKQKKDLKIAYDEKKPFLINGNGGNGDNLIAHSVLTGFQEGLAPGYTIRKQTDLNKQILTGYNQSILKLFSMAFLNKGYLDNNRTIIEAKNVNRVKYIGKEGDEDGYKIWANANTYCYELVLPLDQAIHSYPRMLADLHSYFPQYEASIEPRKVLCYILERTSAIDKIKAGNSGQKRAKFERHGFELRSFPLYRIIQELALIYQQKSLYPIIDGSKYKQLVDMNIQANLTNMDSLNQALEKYDLKFNLKTQVIDMLVIRDKKI